MLAFAMMAVIRHRANPPPPKKTPGHSKNQSIATPSLIRWSIQEVPRIAIRLARKRIQPAHIIAWSLWRMYVLSTGCQWRAVPKDLPARSTLFDYLNLWSWDGTLDRVHHALYVECREQGDREASPTAAIIDSQSPGRSVEAFLRLASIRLMLRKLCNPI
jgi:transposase